MKKYCVAFTLLALGLSNQNAIAQEIKTGFKIGLNASNLHEEAAETKNKYSFHAGMFIEAFINEKFAIQPELLYSSQGSKEEGKMPFPFSGIPAKATLTLNYINLPIMFKYYPITELSITAGPQIGFLVNSKLDIESKYLSNIEVDQSLIKSELSKFDYGINFGLEYNYSGVFFSARYNLGLADIQRQNNSSSKAYNRVFQLSTGYKF